MASAHYTNTTRAALVPTARIGPKHQVTIPKEIFDRLRLETGDYLDVAVTAHSIVMVPKKLVPKYQEWFYTREWQDKEHEADEAIVHGEVSDRFETVDELMAHLERVGPSVVRTVKNSHANTDDHTL